MAGTKLTLLICLSLSSLSAELVTVNLSGITTGGDYTVVQNSYSGLYSTFPGDYYSAGTTTTFGAGTAWTAQFTFDTALMPASIQSNASGLNGSDPITTHTSSSPAQWTTATFSIGGFTFTTAADPLDVPPGAVPPSQFLSVTTPLVYDNRLAYGDTNFAAQGVHGFSGVNSSYSFLDQSIAPGNPSSINYGRFGALSFHIYQSDTMGPLYPGALPTSFSFSDTDLPTSGSHFGFGFAGFSSFFDRFTTENGNLLVDASYASASGADLVVLSATAAGSTPDYDPVPEPSTLVLSAIGAGALALTRRRS